MAKKKKKLADGAAAVPSAAAAGADESEGEGSPKGAGRLVGTVARGRGGAAALSAAQRLASFGEAFMSSIDGPPPKPKNAPPPRASAGLHLAFMSSIDGRADPSKPAEERKVGPAGLPGEGKKRRRNKSKKARLEKLALQGKGASEAMPSKGSSLAAPAGVRQLEARPAGPTAASAVPELRSKPPQMSARDKRNFMSGKVSDIRARRSEDDPLSGSKKRGSERTEEDAEFQKTLRDVLHFVTPRLGKRERQQYEDAKIRALGGSTEKQHMPYRRFQETIKVNREKRKKLVEEDKLAGVEMSANAYKASWVVDSVLKKKKEALKDKKKRREDGFLRLGMGAREKGGMATIPRAAIKLMQKGGGKKL